MLAFEDAIKTCEDQNYNNFAETPSEVLEDTAIEEFDSLMQAGLDEIAVGDIEIATEYFSDAAYVIKDLPNNLREELCNKYEINPLDFAC